MNRLISNVIRCQYANNVAAAAVSRQKALNAISEYFTSVFVRTDKNGREVSCNAPLVNAIFGDIYSKTGMDFRTENCRNTRKRLLGIGRHAVDYTPSLLIQDAVVRYTGLGSWNELEQKAEERLEALEQNLKEIRNGLTAVKTASGVHDMSNLPIDSHVTISFIDGKSMRMRALGRCRFIVSSSREGLPMVNTIIVTDSHLVEGNLLFATTGASCYLSTTRIHKVRTECSLQFLTAA